MYCVSKRYLSLAGKASSSSNQPVKGHTMEAQERHGHWAPGANSLSPNKDTSFMFDKNKQTYICPVCRKEYRSSSGARHHYKIKHCGLFDHYCQVCGKGFQQRSHLKSHMSMHMQHKEFKCDICGFEYVHKTSLTAHQKMAHGIY